jgi:glycosyltransferase involved in cell wall biosynthesis
MNNTGSALASRISVVVPVLNEANSIRALLDGLLNQTRRPDEIVITDGASTDNTCEIIEEFVAAGAPVKLIRETFSLPGRSRNIGVANARNDWIAFTDAGVRPEQDWLERLASKAGEDVQTDVVYGSYNPVINNFFEECAAIAYVPPPAEDGARPYSIVSALMRRKVWESVGRFPEHLRSAEDLLFMRKVEQARFRIARAPQAIVHWTLQPSLWRTFKRFVTYARNNIRAGLGREWQLPIFLRYALLLIFLIPAAVIGWWWLLVGLGLWLGFMTARAVKSIYRNRATYTAGFVRNVARLFVLLPILTAIDIAAFAGSINWFLRDKLRLGKTN